VKNNQKIVEPMKQKERYVVGTETGNRRLSPGGKYAPDTSVQHSPGFLKNISKGWFSAVSSIYYLHLSTHFVGFWIIYKSWKLLHCSHLRKSKTVIIVLEILQQCHWFCNYFLCQIRRFSYRFSDESIISLSFTSIFSNPILKQNMDNLHCKFRQNFENC